MGNVRLPFRFIGGLPASQRRLPTSIKGSVGDNDACASDAQSYKCYKRSYAIDPILNSPITPFGAAVMFLGGCFSAFVGLRSGRGLLFAIGTVGAGLGAGWGCLWWFWVHSSII
jgi:hypothetical protein